jgi:YVTN family beta-propeller protein
MAEEQKKETSAAGKGTAEEQTQTKRIEEGGGVREEIVAKGTKIEFSAKPATGSAIMEGEFADIAIKVTDATTGSPVTPLSPGAWIDLKTGGTTGKEAEGYTCDQKVNLYFKGIMTFRPMLDLNSYFILTMNNDASISVIDPIIGMQNITHLYSMIHLKKPGEDWTFGRDEKQLFVTMPKADEVAVVSVETFKVLTNIPVGSNPVRIALQPDKKYLWVGLDPDKKEESGVAVIEAGKQEKVAFIPTGAGHHEIAFSDDSLYAFVTNSKDGTLSIIDVQALKKVKDIELKGLPVGVAYSSLSKAAYVSVGDAGYVAVVDGKSHTMTAKITGKPGLWAIRFAPGDRWGFVLNAKEGLVQVFDTADNKIRYTTEVDKEPDQIMFTKNYAYVRSRATNKVNLLSLTDLGKAEKLPAIEISGGQKPPKEAQFESIADNIVESSMEGHLVVVNPADGIAFYYMEGMSVPMGSYRIYGGHLARSPKVVSRNLRQIAPGVYGTRIKVPASGEFEVAMLIDSPRVTHCFNFTAKTNPDLDKTPPYPNIEYLNTDWKAKAPGEFKVSFKLVNPRDGMPVVGANDVYVQNIHSSGFPSFTNLTKHVGNGVYEVDVKLPKEGIYYIMISSPSLKLSAKDRVPVQLRALADKEKK